MAFKTVLILAFAIYFVSAANYGSFKKDQCRGTNLRQYSAILWDIPWFASWENACANTPATVQNVYFSRATRCVNTGLNMWGEFDVNDPNDCPYYGSFQKDGCKGVDAQDRYLRQYSAILWDIPSGVDWNVACNNKRATVNGVSFNKATRCSNTGLNMWGQFDLVDPTCAPNYGSFQKDFCTGENPQRQGFRQYSSILWNIPPYVDWNKACQITPATVNGVNFQKATRCIGPQNSSIVPLVVNQWGEFDVLDSSCNVSPQWVNNQIQVLLRRPFSCNWTNWLTDGCSNPLNDRASVAFKDIFHQACVFHDYCYASPWKTLNVNGKPKCDDQFLHLMLRSCVPTGSACDNAISTCNYNQDCLNNVVSCAPYTPCFTAAGVFYIAVVSAGQSSYNNAQNALGRNIICTV